MEQKRTFCRVCEPACGMIATVEDGELVKLEADKEHPISKGFVCNKGIYGADIHNDPDRLRYPLKRNEQGEFEQVSWDTALKEIAARAQAIKDRYGDTALAGYAGNPGAFNTLLGPSYGSFMVQLGARKFFSSGTQDCANKFAGSAAVFGTRTMHPLPDIQHADFIMIMGENPAVSHMSFMSVSNPMQRLKDAEKRGAEILFVNPRQIESANQVGSVLKIKPDTDVYLLAALLHEINETNGFHEDAEFHGERVADLKHFVADYPAERVAPVVGIEAEQIKALAQQIASAPRAAVHMSTGVNMGRQGTLAYWLLHMLSLVTGNLGRKGGNYHSLGFYSRAANAGRKFSEDFLDTPWGIIRQPGDGFSLPGNLMADYITYEQEPIKALFVSSGNPALSIAGEAKMREALESLELLVCVDIYRNATAEYADYVLPAAGAFEREDINITGLGLQVDPSVQFTEAVVQPGYERKPDWWIWEKLSQSMGYRSAFDESDEPDMWTRVNAMLTSRGSSMTQLRSEQVIVIDSAPPESLFERVQSEDKKVDCYPAVFADSITRMDEIFSELEAEDATALKLITKRDAYMFNSWYANVDKLKRGDRQTNYLFMHPQDAEIRQIADGAQVQVENEFGELQTEVRLTDELRQGVVAMTHGWGHGQSNGMTVAKSKPGVNCNVLLPVGRASFEPLSNQSHMTGINVDVRLA